MKTEALLHPLYTFVFPRNTRARGTRTTDADSNPIGIGFPIWLNEDLVEDDLEGEMCERKHRWFFEPSLLLIFARSGITALAAPTNPSSHMRLRIAAHRLLALNEIARALKSLPKQRMLCLTSRFLAGIFDSALDVGKVTDCAGTADAFVTAMRT